MQIIELMMAMSVVWLSFSFSAVTDVHGSPAAPLQLSSLLHRPYMQMTKNGYFVSS